MFALFLILALLVCLLPAVAVASSGRSSRPGPRSTERPIPTLNLAMEEELTAEAEETVTFLPPRSDAEAEDTEAEAVTEADAEAEAYFAEAAEGNDTPCLMPPEEPSPEEVESIPVEPQETAPVECHCAFPSAWFATGRIIP